MVNATLDIKPPLTSGRSNLRIAIVCDWLTGIGGAERVVFELHRMFPRAPIYTSQYDPGEIDWFKDADVRTGWLQHFSPKIKKFLVPFRALYFSRLNLNDYDIIISSSGAEAKGIRVPRGVTHVSYIHAPTHYYWSRYDSYMKEPGFGIFNPVARLGLKLLAGPMRRWDYNAAQRPHYLIANSRHTKEQIKKYYGRESTVIHPPVDVNRFKGPMTMQRKGFVTAGRQTPYKRIDLAVKACTNLGAPLVVIGTGPDHERLRRLAGRNITFLTHVRDKDMRDDFKAAEAFIFPGIDDFGIVAVEAMAAGLPVIAYRGGGALDYIIEGRTGLFFDKQTPTALAKILSDFKPHQFNANFIAKHAEQFSPQFFHRKLVQFLASIR
jgi:glycosyltransferase involved in cell wall biosynthesis